MWLFFRLEAFTLKFHFIDLLSGLTLTTGWLSSTGGAGAPPEPACPPEEILLLQVKNFAPPDKRSAPFLKIPLETCSFD